MLVYHRCPRATQRPRETNFSPPDPADRFVMLPRCDGRRRSPDKTVKRISIDHFRPVSSWRPASLGLTDWPIKITNYLFFAPFSLCELREGTLALGSGSIFKDWRHIPATALPELSSLKRDLGRLTDGRLKLMWWGGCGLGRWGGWMEEE